MHVTRIFYLNSERINWIWLKNGSSFKLGVHSDLIVLIVQNAQSFKSIEKIQLHREDLNFNIYSTYCHDEDAIKKDLLEEIEGLIKDWPLETTGCPSEVLMMATGLAKFGGGGGGGGNIPG